MTESNSPLTRPTRADFESEAKAVIARIPSRLREELAEVTVRIEEFATAEQLASVEITDRWELTGLYEGAPLPERSLWDEVCLPPVITLFRQPLLREMDETGVGFEELVRHVVIHEAGHHFGFSDEDMHALEDMIED
jgi:predicted Zn-dependent protease with MMP-like domain